MIDQSSFEVRADDGPFASRLSPTAVFERPNDDSSPSLLMQKRLAALFRLGDGDPRRDRIEQVLTGFSNADFSMNRSMILAQAVSGIYADPPAPALVASRIDSDPPTEFLLESTDGRQFFIIDSLATGGFGVVYLAEDSSFPPEDTRHTQAIKQLRKVSVQEELRGEKWVPSTPDPESAVARFTREARFAKELSGRGLSYIVPQFLGRGIRKIVGEGGEIQRLPFIQYEFSRSISIKQLRDGIGDETLPLSAFYDYGVQMSTSLYGLHRAGFVHRDIKPGNILLRSDGKGAPIIDYGFMKRMGESDGGIEAETELTQPGTCMGTPYYMPPEQWVDAESVGSSADVYAFAITMYQMLTGRQLFTGSKTELCMAHQQTIPTAALDHLRSLKIAENLVILFERALSKDPSERPTAKDFVAGFLKHSSFDRSMKPDEVLDRTKKGDMRVKLPDELLEQVSKPDAPFPSGYVPNPSSRDDCGARSMYETLREHYPEAMQTKTRSSLRRLLWPTVALGLGAAAVGYGSLTHQDEPQTVTKLPPVVQPDVMPEKRQSEDPTPSESPVVVETVRPFSSADLFHGEFDESGSLKAFSLFAGKAFECKFSEGKFQTHTKDGALYALTFAIPKEQFIAMVGTLPDNLKDRNDFSSGLYFDPSGKRTLLSLPQSMLITTEHEEARVFSGFAAKALQDGLGKGVESFPQGKFAYDADIHSVARAIPIDFDPLPEGADEPRVKSRSAVVKFIGDVRKIADQVEASAKEKNTAQKGQ